MGKVVNYSNKITKIRSMKNQISDPKSKQFEKDEYFYYLKERLNQYDLIEKSEHELTRKHISDKLEDLLSQIATKDELIKAKEEIIFNIKKESLATQEKLKSEIKDLKSVLLSFVPHKRAFKISLYFVTLFLFFTFSDLFFNIQIVDKFWGSLGLFVSGGFLIMSYFLFLDWKGK